MIAPAAVRLDRSMMATLLGELWGTSALLPSGVITTSPGRPPTAMAWVLKVARSTTVTEPGDESLAITACDPVGLTATPCGPGPTGTGDDSQNGPFEATVDPDLLAAVTRQK